MAVVILSPAQVQSDLSRSQTVEDKAVEGLNAIARGRARVMAAAHEDLGRLPAPEEVDAFVWRVMRSRGEDDRIHRCLFCDVPNMVHSGGRLISSEIYGNAYICQHCVRRMAGQLPHISIVAQRDWGSWFAPTVIEITWREAVMLLVGEPEASDQHH